jgi:hypothetical protein
LLLQRSTPLLGYAARRYGRFKSEAAIRRHRSKLRVRKLIAFDDDTFDKLKQLARDRMGTLQELADEAFSDLLKKHGIPVDLKDALRKSASLSKTPAQKNAGSKSRQKKS